MVRKRNWVEGLGGGDDAGIRDIFPFVLWNLENIKFLWTVLCTVHVKLEQSKILYNPLSNFLVLYLSALHAQLYNFYDEQLVIENTLRKQL